MADGQLVMATRVTELFDDPSRFQAAIIARLDNGLELEIEPEELMRFPQSLNQWWPRNPLNVVTAILGLEPR